MTSSYDAAGKPTKPDDAAPGRFVAVVGGRVQGVGFRWFVQERAHAHGIAGSVRNLPSGAVEVEAEGTDEALQALLVELHQGPPAARVSDVAVRWQSAQGVRGFVIRTS